MQLFSFSHTTFSDKQLAGHIISVNALEFIGTYEMYVNGETFISAINIFTDYQKLGIGFHAFKFCYDTLSETNDLKYFIASWSKDKEYSHLTNGSSVNLTRYFELIEDGIDKEIALWQTPTGKWLKKLGFDKASISESNREFVKATFFR